MAPSLSWVHRAILVVLFVSPLQSPPLSWTAAAAADEEDDVHARHAHLAPRAFGQGLRNQRYQKLIQRRRRSRSREQQRPRGRPNERAKRKKKKKAVKKKKKQEQKKKKDDKKDGGGGGGGRNNAKNKPPSASPGGNNSKNKPSRPSSKNPAAGDSGGQFAAQSGDPAAQALHHLSRRSSTIDNTLFLYEHPTEGWRPSTIYQHDGLAKALRVMHGQGVGGMRYYLGDRSDGPRGVEYGLTNVAAFVAQSMKETIRYDACDENNWDLYNEGYPLSNACGQLGQSYQEYHCPKGEEHMECPVDPDMEITAVTNARWYGAPAPLFCRPKKNKDDFTGKWNHGKFCNLGWVDPPLQCEDYEGQKAGGYDNDDPVANRAGRTDTEGCCWWGRGVIQTTGVCNFGKLNYYLGSRAAKEGRTTPYGDIDFCRDPEIICSSKKHEELKWIAGQ